MIQTTHFRLKPYGKSDGLTQTTHVRLKPYAWVSFKPFIRTQTMWDIRRCCSNHSLQTHTIRVGVIQTIRLDSNHIRNSVVLFKPPTSDQTISVGVIQTIHQDSNHNVSHREARHPLKARHDPCSRWRYLFSDYLIPSAAYRVTNTIKKREQP